MDDLHEWVCNQLWDQVPVAISVINPEFRILEANRTFTQRYGAWRDRTCYELYKGKSEPCERCAAVKCFRDGRIRDLEEQGKVCDDKPTYYFVQMVPLIRADGSIPYVIEMSTDITKTKRLLQDKLEAERLAAVGQTVAGLAHGIKNVLMGLDGGMYVVRSGMQKGDAAIILQGWQMLEDNISRITSFVKEFLDFARGRTPEVQEIDLNAPARAVLELFQDTARLAGIELIGKLQEGMAPAAMDTEGIHTCLANLVSNAIDACKLSDRPNQHVTLSTYERQGSIFYEVVDDGAGMDYEIRKRIFSSFFSTKASGKGTGLGLLTTRRIVQEHGGKVSFETTEGRGSVFSLEFPRERLPKPRNAGEKEGAVSTEAAARRV